MPNRRVPARSRRGTTRRASPSIAPCRRLSGYASPSRRAARRCGLRKARSVTAEPRFEPERVVAALNEAGVRYVIVGGLAVGAHGVVRATRDIDVVPDHEPQNMGRLARALTRLGGEHPVHGDLTGDALARPVSMKLNTRAGEVHVL